MSVEITDNTDKFKDAKNDAVIRALEAIGLQAEGYAKRKCPVDTGNLRNSITHRQEDEETEVIGTAVEYGKYVEYGTQRMAARPFLKPAALDHAEEYRAIFNDELRKG